MSDNNVECHFHLLEGFELVREYQSRLIYSFGSDIICSSCKAKLNAELDKVKNGA